MRSDLGNKIKKRRKTLNLTQTQIAGEGITRNMISLIENGNALPSLQTLEYLSARLEVPMSYFFTEEFENESSSQNEAKQKIKKLYLEKNYTECIELALSLYKYSSDMSDELLLICAEAAFLSGKTKLLKGAFESASYYFGLARDFSLKCPYCTEWIDASIYLFESVIENSDCPIQALDKEYFMKLRRCVGYEYYNYLCAIKLIDENKADELTYFLKRNKVIETAHKEHINAKLMMISESSEQKHEALDLLCIIIKKAPSYSLDAVTRYLVLKDIEQLARELDNFELAYKYATMRIKIISDMRE